MKTFVISTRFSEGLNKLIISEADRLKVPQSEFLRIVLRAYFNSRQKQDQLEVLEKRLINHVDAQTQRLATMLQQVLSMAQA